VGQLGSLGVRRIVVTWFGRTGHLDRADRGERVADRVARGWRPSLGGCGRAEDGRAARDADGGQRPGDPGGWADVVRVAVLWLPDERLQLLPASRAELYERER
jgi:hypothetical protein